MAPPTNIWKLGRVKRCISRRIWPSAMTLKMTPDPIACPTHLPPLPLPCPGPFLRSPPLSNPCHVPRTPSPRALKEFTLHSLCPLCAPRPHRSPLAHALRGDPYRSFPMRPTPRDPPLHTHSLQVFFTLRPHDVGRRGLQQVVPRNELRFNNARRRGQTCETTAALCGGLEIVTRGGNRIAATLTAAGSSVVLTAPFDPALLEDPTNEIVRIEYGQGAVSCAFPDLGL